MKYKYANVLSFVQKTPWAILPEKGVEIMDFLSQQAQGVKFSAEEIEARTSGSVGRPRAATNGDVAVLPLYGVVSQRINEAQAISGSSGTSIEKFTKRFQEAVANPNVKAIVLQIDSPGGSVYGIAELANQIYEARSQKYIVAVADSLAASAAFWIASAASEVVVTPGGEVGSVGVYMMHADYSAQLESDGVKTTFISAGKYKIEANPFQALTEDAKAYLQSQVDAYNNMFVGALAKYRGVATSVINENYGQGRVVMAKDAKARGMVDKIATFDEVLAGLGVNNKPQSVSAETPKKRYAELESKKLAIL